MKKLSALQEGREMEEESIRSLKPWVCSISLDSGLSASSFSWSQGVTGVICHALASHVLFCYCCCCPLYLSFDSDFGYYDCCYSHCCSCRHWCWQKHHFPEMHPAFAILATFGQTLWSWRALLALHSESCWTGHTEICPVRQIPAPYLPSCPDHLAVFPPTIEAKQMLEMDQPICLTQLWPAILSTHWCP